MERVVPGRRELLQTSSQDCGHRGGEQPAAPCPRLVLVPPPGAGRGPTDRTHVPHIHPAPHNEDWELCGTAVPPPAPMASGPSHQGTPLGSQTGVAARQGFIFIFFYFSLNICCQTLYRSKLLHSTTSHLLFRIGRIRRVEVKSKHRRAGKAPRCIA